VLALLAYELGKSRSHGLVTKGLGVVPKQNGKVITMVLYIGELCTVTTNTMHSYDLAKQ
jgi:hypothetical protein